jgi:hypothetical protein
VIPRRAIDEPLLSGRTYKYSGLRSDNNSETRLLKPLSRIISAFSRRVKKIIVGGAFRQMTYYCRKGIPSIDRLLSEENDLFD